MMMIDNTLVRGRLYSLLKSPCNFLLVLLLLAAPVQANRLYFTDGESITGVMVGIEDGKLHWKSAILGDLKVDLHNIEMIETGDHFDLKLTGKELRNCWMYAEGDSQFLHCDEGVQTLPSWKLVVAAGETINEPQPWLQQTGDAKLALEDSSGNSEITKYDLQVRTELRYLESRHTIAANYAEESSDGNTNRQRWRAGYQYDQFFTEQWFVTGNAFYEEDKFRELDQRASAGLGMGYQFLETSYFDLLGKGTLNYVDEEFSSGLSRSRPALLWNMDFVWRVEGGGMEFFHRHVMLQSFEESADYEVNTTTGFKYPINGHFDSVIQLDYNYDNLPGEKEVEKVDSKWSVGLNYKW